MVDSNFSMVRRVSACALVGAALILGACGSEDDGGAQAGSSEAGDGSEFVATGSDEQQIRQVLRGIQEDFDNVDGAAFCDKVVESDQREIVRFGRNYNKGKTCVEVIETTGAEARATGVEQRPTVPLSSPQVTGDRARVRVSNGGRPPEWMAFRKVEGEWKIVDSGLEADPIAAAQELAEKQARAQKRQR
jgi:hypothetical protein